MKTKILSWKKLMYSIICIIGLLVCTEWLPAVELIEVGRITIPGRGWVNMHVAGNYVYLVKYGEPEKFCVVNVTDRSNPRIEGQINDLPFSNAHDLWYANGFAYTAHRFGGVNMIDVTNPGAPFVCSSAPSTYTQSGIMSVGKYLYLADHSAYSYPGGIRIYDISDDNLNLVGTLLGNIDGRNFAVSSDGLYCYQSSGKDEWDAAKLFTYDVSDKTNPKILNFIPNIFGIEVLISPDDRWLYMSYHEPNDFTPPPKGIKIYVLGNRSQPQEISTFLLTNSANLALDAEHKLLYVKVYYDQNNPSQPGIHVLDISDPSLPTEIYYLEGTKFSDIFYADNYLYVDTYQAWDPQNELIIFSTREPVLEASIEFDPQTLNKKSNGLWIAAHIELPEGYDVNDIDVNTIQLNKIDGQALTIPISAAPKPTTIGDYDNDQIPDLMVKFDRAVVIAALGDKEGEVELSVTGEIAGKEFEGGDIVRVIDPPNQKTRCSCLHAPVPTDYTLFQNFPNPFNPQTTLRYSLSEASRVTLVIYNLNGAAIKTLIQEPRPAGTHSVNWDGTDEQNKIVPAGIYFCQLQAIGTTLKFSRTRKLNLIK
ncbi:T9SS type A sorting domain-containing protein [candidate division KSB1 bacterium]|nr:T9SS type A sorting domain-containing protein [candidate division KSB1 bacterium]